MHLTLKLTVKVRSHWRNLNQTKSNRVSTYIGQSVGEDHHPSPATVRWSQLRWFCHPISVVPSLVIFTVYCQSRRHFPWMSLCPTTAAACELFRMILLVSRVQSCRYLHPRETYLLNHHRRMYHVAADKIWLISCLRTRYSQCISRSGRGVQTVTRSTTRLEQMMIPTPIALSRLISLITVYLYLTLSVC